MSVFNRMHTLIGEEHTIGAYKNEIELQCQFVSLSLGQLCPVSIIYPTQNAGYKRIDTLRAQEFTVCFRDGLEPDCKDLCIKIVECLSRIYCGAEKNCLLEANCYPHCFLQDEESNFEYLEFTCPMSGLTKYAFPIKYKENLICVVFVGQFNVICGSLDTRSQCESRKQFESQASLRKYISQYIIPEIINFRKSTAKNFEAQEKTELYSLLRKAESNLNRSMMKVLACNDDAYLDDFSILHLFWNNVRKAYLSLFQEMGADRVTIFIDDDFSNSARMNRYLYSRELYSTGKENTLETRKQNSFDLKNAAETCGELQTDSISSLDISDKKILRRYFADYEVDSDCQYDYVFNVNETYLPYAILIEHHNTKISENVVDLLRKIAVNIRFELSSVLTKLSEYTSKSILRIYRHEIVHQVLAIRSHINYLDPEDKIYVSQEKLDNIYYDCSDCLDALSFMTENIELFTSHTNSASRGIIESCEYKTVDIFKDVIHKHIAMHRELRNSKNLWFESIGRTEESLQFNCQPKLLNLILFNIISNAVKYAHQHTNVHFCYSEVEEKHNTRRFEIRDFGSDIELGDDIYRLYYRGTSAKHAETGSGIGLFISKRIAEAMGVKLYHTCKRVSDYNVPLLEEYLEIYSEYDGRYIEEVPDFDTIIGELARLRNAKQYNQIVNTTARQPSNLCADELVAQLLKPTYEVTFILEL